MSREFLIFDDKNTIDFGVWLYSSSVLNAPRRDAEGEAVAGKNGEIIHDNGRLENVTITYTGLIKDEMKTNLTALRSFMLSRVGYCRLQDSFNPEEFRMAKFEEGFEVTHDRWFSMSKFPMVFNCRPERWLVDGEQDVAITSTATQIMNPTYFDARPFFTVTGNGTITVSNEDETYTMVLAGTSGEYYIDCEYFDCYGLNDGEYVNLNSKITVTDSLSDYPHFPVLRGDMESSIIATGFTSVSMRPRWWQV